MAGAFFCLNLRNIVIGTEYGPFQENNERYKDRFQTMKRKFHKLCGAPKRPQEPQSGRWPSNPPT